MLHWRVRCPGCGMLLQMPSNIPQRIARCGHCHARFSLPDKIGIKDDTIASWLDVDPDEEGQVGLVDQDAIQDAHQTPTTGETQILPAINSNQLRLVNLDSKAAMFEFPADRLKDSAFRLSMPRRCLRCGTSSHLEAHVIQYVSHLPQPISLQAAHAAGPLVMRPSEAENLIGERLLEKLPAVPNVPPPADIPMPYWLCDLCSTAGSIAGQIRVNSETGRGMCRLIIHNLRRAEEFMIAAGGEDSPDHEKLTAQIQESNERPWDMLPMTVQERVKQWFRPSSGERFVAYVPDRDRTRTEDGVYGMVVSNKRLIYHDKFRHHEVVSDQPVELTLAERKGEGRLQLVTMAWQIKSFHMDRAGAKALRRALAHSGQKTTWR